MLGSPKKISFPKDKDPHQQGQAATKPKLSLVRSQEKEGSEIDYIGLSAAHTQGLGKMFI